MSWSRRGSVRVLLYVHISSHSFPFDEFTMGFLRVLNVAPTQLHPNSRASLQDFYLLFELVKLKSSL